MSVRITEASDFRSGSGCDYPVGPYGCFEGWAGGVPVG